MTVFVTEPALRGNRMLKPQVVSTTYSTGDTLHWLVSRNPDAIYYTDDTSEWDAAPDTDTWTERALVYTNAFGEDMRLVGASEHDFKWRADNEDYANVRWETRTVTHTTTQWKIEESK